MTTGTLRRLAWGAIYAFLLVAFGFSATAAGHGSYLLLQIASAPFGILGLQLGLAMSPAILSPFLLWPGIAILHGRPNGKVWPVFDGAMLLHYLGVAILPFTDWFSEDLAYLFKHWPQIRFPVVSGLCIYAVGQVLLWSRLARSTGPSEGERFGELSSPDATRPARSQPVNSEALSELYARTQQSDPDARSRLATAWCQLAESDPLSLAAFLASVPLDSSCVLFEVYEAISLLDPPPQRFFQAELRRLLAEAHEDPTNREIYSQLEAFAFLGGEHRGDLGSKLASTLLETLGSEVPQLRRLAARLGYYFIGPDLSDLQLKLRELLDTDPDWRVRLIAHSSLSQLAKDYPAALPAPSLGFMDSLRARFSSSAWDVAP